MRMVTSGGKTTRFEMGGEELYLHEEGVRFLFVMFRVVVRLLSTMMLGMPQVEFINISARSSCKLVSLGLFPHRAVLSTSKMLVGRLCRTKASDKVIRD
jgi:hypothetical protein